MQLEQNVVDVFLIFCRVGACLMIIPGLASARVPSRIRLYVALIVAFVVAPVVPPAKAGVAVANLTALIAGELAIGAVMGLIGRCVLEALEFGATAISHFIGLTAFADLVGEEPRPTLAVVVGAWATIVSDLPQLAITGLIDSYTTAPSQGAFDSGTSLEALGTVLTLAFRASLQMAAPFLVYGVLVNASFSILGRLVPQVSSYFVSGPFLTIGGLMLLLASTPGIGAIIQSTMSDLAFAAISRGIR
jgi:flagellar biosynthesis protein FliR